MYKKNPDAISSDEALDAILLVEHGVKTLADMGIHPIVWKATGLCSAHGQIVGYASEEHGVMPIIPHLICRDCGRACMVRTLAKLTGTPLPMLEGGV